MRERAHSANTDHKHKLIGVTHFKHMTVMENITESFERAEEIIVYRNGVEEAHPAGSASFEKIVLSLKIITENARQMPAYGVSLDGLTRTAMKDGLWVELRFCGVCECEGMPFERLLFEVRKSYSGFNLNRYNSDCGYSGRCFYLALADRDMTALYECIANSF